LRKINPNKGAFTSALCELIKNFEYCKNDADQVPNDADPDIFNQPVIGAIKEVFRKQLTSIASKLLSIEHSKLEYLSLEEQNRKVSLREKKKIERKRFSVKTFFVIVLYFPRSVQFLWLN
jgi:hypothetical protein